MDRAIMAQLDKALDHLYDLAYLETCPLATLPEQQALPHTSRGKALRRMLMDAIAALYPPEGTPAADPAWRPYRILQGRYVEGMARVDLQQELALSKTQFYREYDRAMQALARWWQDHGAPTAPAPTAATETDATALALQELDQVARQEPWQRMDLAATLRHALGLLSANVADGALPLALSAAAGPVWVRSRASLLSQSLLGLLSGALQTSPPAALRVSLGQGAGVAWVDVRGVEDWDEVLRGQAGRVARALAQVAGGRLSVAEAPDAGVRLSFGAPRQQQMLLLVDNSSELAELLGRFLADEAWSLLHAPSVAQAMELCARQHPALILLDVLMPGQDGWHLLAWLRQAEALRHIPVVICSVLDQPHLALSLGANGYLSKPVTPAALREVLHRFAPDPDTAAIALPGLPPAGE